MSTGDLVWVSFAVLTLAVFTIGVSVILLTRQVGKLEEGTSKSLVNLALEYQELHARADSLEKDLADTKSHINANTQQIARLASTSLPPASEQLAGQDHTHEPYVFNIDAEGVEHHACRLCSTQID